MAAEVVVTARRLTATKTPNARVHEPSLSQQRREIVAAADESVAMISREHGAVKSISTDLLSTPILRTDGLTAAIKKKGRTNLRLVFIDSAGKHISTSSKAFEQAHPDDILHSVEVLLTRLRSRFAEQRQGILNAPYQKKSWLER
ncbi:MAG: hypothetical protein K1X64_04755 [Myxococcaceae bacterium]|nr:hypothetical protein [Myxococcaceae bacterium]